MEKNEKEDKLSDPIIKRLDALIRLFIETSKSRTFGITEKKSKILSEYKEAVIEK